MGMDLHGKAPTSPAGKYFGNNVWWWRPLANYIAEVAPSFYSESWQYNDSAGLGGQEATQLASLLQAEIDSGRTHAYAAAYDQRINLMPDVQCTICNGTGRRSFGGRIIHCNGCKGEGYRRPWDAHYPFSVENVQKFLAFIRDSGGFSIC